MTRLSAPALSGYEKEFDTVDEARMEAAKLLSGIHYIDDQMIEFQVTVADMVEVESGDGGTTYCYASQEEADSDNDGAYAVQYREAL